IQTRPVSVTRFIGTSSNHVNGNFSVFFGGLVYAANLPYKPIVQAFKPDSISPKRDRCTNKDGTGALGSESIARQPREQSVCIT
ncbi:hypothetical protein, partial [Sneathiella chungangensis]